MKLCQYLLRGLLALVVVLAAGAAGLCADAAPGPLAHWKLDEPAGDSVADAAGGHAGTNHGAEPGRPSPAGSALHFNAAEDDFVDLGTDLQLEGTDRATIAALVRPELFNPPDFQNLANSRNGILGSDDANLIFALCGQGRVTFVWDAGQNDYQEIVSDPDDAVPLYAWSHVAVVRDGPTMTLYINGMPKKSGQFSPNKFVHFGRMCLGRVNGSTARDFSGQLDDVRVYGRALSAAEVWKLAETVKLAGVALPKPPAGRRGLERIKYNHPDLAVDLGVGLWAWPMPMDCDGDGDLDLVVSCSDTPYNGTYVFENPGGHGKMPVFKAGKRIGRGLTNVQVSYVGGKPRVLAPGEEYPDVFTTGLEKPVKLPVGPRVHPAPVRANQWKYADYDGDGRLDLIVGVGDWTEYGWDNAFDAQGRWTRGPLHGYVYLLRNTATNDEPKYAPPVKIEAAGQPVDVYGMPSPNLADFDGDGDLDLLCGEFRDQFTYFENTGTRTAPKYAAGRRLMLDGQPLAMSLCMIVPVAIDWDGDGDLDLVVGQEDGRVALVENTGKLADRLPVFAAPRFFQQEADELKFGALVTPVSFDWDGDGDEDLVCGNTEGQIGFFENLGGGPAPKWAAPRLLEADGRIIRIVAGPNGSIQGPCEAKWGYTTLSVADWDGDGLPDLLVNSIWGKVHWYRNVGTRRSPRLASAAPIEVQWPGKPPKPAWTWWEPQGNELATQWRTTPVAIDWNRDGLCDLVMLDQEGYLAFFRRTKQDGKLVLLPPERAFGDGKGSALRLNPRAAGGSGRRKFCFADWDGDGRVDLLIDSINVAFFRNQGERDGRTVLANQGPLDSRRLAGHDTSPTVVDWDRDGLPDVLVGAEDGYFYYLANPRTKAAAP
jgi:hypothetical protein